MARLAGLVAKGYLWVVFPDWRGMAWVYLGTEPIALTLVTDQPLGSRGSSE